MRWRGIFKELSRDGGRADFSNKKPAPLSLMKTYRVEWAEFRLDPSRWTEPLNIPQAIGRSFVGVIGYFPVLWIGIKTIQIRIRISHVDAETDPDPDRHQNNADPHADPTPKFYTWWKIRFLYFWSQHCHFRMFYLSHQCRRVVCFKVLKYWNFLEKSLLFQLFHLLRLDTDPDQLDSNQHALYGDPEPDLAQ
jgi:hypothetical protein